MMDTPAHQNLKQQVEFLGSHDYRVVEEAENALLQAGQAGIEAAIQGLSHPNPRVRRGSASFMDHHGTEQCIEALKAAALTDTVPYVRWQAIHSLGCQRCKAQPLAVDGVALLIESALSDSSIRVRRGAVSGLNFQAPDVRAIPVLQTILQQEPDQELRRLAHHALKHHDPHYRAEVAEEARKRNQSRLNAESNRYMS